MRLVPILLMRGLSLVLLLSGATLFLLYGHWICVALVGSAAIIWAKLPAPRFDVAVLMRSLPENPKARGSATKHSSD